MKYQNNFHLEMYKKPVIEVLRQYDDGELTLNPPYQRQSVWPEDAQKALIHSMLLGIPVPAIILNNRWMASVKSKSENTCEFTAEDDIAYSIVDGKQRLEALLKFFHSKLSVPVEWFIDNNPAQEDIDDLLANPQSYTTNLEVYFNDLNKPVQLDLRLSKFLINCAEASLYTIKAEAELYLLINTTGTAQTEADIENARRIAKEGVS